MSAADVILSYRGPITQDLLNAVYTVMEKQAEAPESLKLRKRMYYILVECLQNIFHHNETPSVDSGQQDDDALFVIAHAPVGGYRIITGNYIKSGSVTELKNKIDEVNLLDSQSIKEKYRDKLNSTSLSDKGGAGLGLLDMARKSDEKIEYSFEPVSEEMQFFILTITIR